MRIVLLILKILAAVVILLILLIITFAGSYLQSLSLALLIVILFYWPFLQKKKTLSVIMRLAAAAILILLQFTLFKGEPKESIYISSEMKEMVYEVYQEKAAFWPDETEHIFLETKYGEVHIMAFGDRNLPPILLFHAASMGAHSWAENLAPLIGRYRIYAIDNIGEGNLSELKDALIYPNSSREIADLYAYISDQLGIKNSPVLASSNGGYIAQVYAFHYPDRVESLALFGPMGITPLSGKSIFMMSAASLFPLDGVRNKVANWALGKDEYCREKYGDWFDVILKGTIPSIAMPQPLRPDQRRNMDIPILLFLGTEDPIVGDADTAVKEAEYYPDIEIHVLESGHLIAVEKREIVNRAITEFLLPSYPSATAIEQ